MNLALGLGLASQQRAAFWADPFRSLFRDGGKGALLSSAAPSANWTTDAGVTLAGFGDPVGLALDIKNGVPAPAGPGAHFSTSVTADRLTRGREPLGGVRNLLDYSEQFDNAAWSKTQTVAVSVTDIIAPDGTATASRILRGDGVTSGALLQTSSVSSGQTKSIWAKSPPGQGTKTTALLGFNGIAKYQFTITEEWQRFDAPSDADETGGTTFYAVDFRHGTATEVDIWQPQIELGSTATAYQSRVTINDVTEAGVADVPFYRFDGVSDRLEGNATARDILKGAPGVTFICAFRPASLAAQQYLFSASIGGSASVRFGVRINATSGTLGAAYRRLDGDAAVVPAASSGGSVVGQTKILTVTADFANGGAGAIVFRENGVQVGTADIAGTGNFADTTSQNARVGATGADSLFANGQLFREIVILGRRASDAEIAAAEARLAALTGVTL